MRNELSDIMKKDNQMIKKEMSGKKGIFDLPKNFNIVGNTKVSLKNKRKPIGKALRDIVWVKYMGNKTQGKCYCCRIKPIHFTEFEIGHNRAVSRGGENHINNLRPICKSCNKAMRTKSIEWWKKKYFAKPTTKKPRAKKKRTARKSYNPFGIDFKI